MAFLLRGTWRSRMDAGRTVARAGQGERATAHAVALNRHVFHISRALERPLILRRLSESPEIKKGIRSVAWGVPGEKRPTARASALETGSALPSIQMSSPPPSPLPPVSSERSFWKLARCFALRSRLERTGLFVKLNTSLAI